MIELSLGARLIRVRRRNARTRLGAKPTEAELRAAGLFVLPPTEVEATMPAPTSIEVPAPSLAASAPIEVPATILAAAAPIEVAAASESAPVPIEVAAASASALVPIEVPAPEMPPPAPAWTKATGVAPPSATTGPRFGRPAAPPPAEMPPTTEGVAPVAGSGQVLALIRNAAIAVLVVVGILFLASSVMPRSAGQGEVLGATATQAGAGSSVTAGLPTATAGVPTAAANALRLTITVDDRLAGSAATLRTHMAGKGDPVAIAATLREIAATAAWGIDVVGRLGDWPAAAELRGSLRAYYVSIATTARDGLNASIQSATAYQAAGKRMLALTDQVAAVRASTVTFATANGIDLQQP